MARRRRGSTRSTIATLIGALIVGIATLIGAIGGGLIGPGESAATATPSGPAGTPIARAPGEVESLNFSQGFGAQKDFWQVYFTAPTGSTDESTYTGGVDIALVNAINSVQGTLDIAAFEWNNPLLTQAVIVADNRGVQVRMVVDNEHTLEDEDSTIQQIIDAGIPVVDDDRSGLMHNKFMIMDRTTVWTGSMNYTMNGTYRNNNNMLALRSQRAVEVYQIEFNEMFQSEEFGSSRSEVNSAFYSQDGAQIQILFAPEDNVVPSILQVLENAETSIRFMTFSFTLDEVGDALLERAEAGVDVRGVFEVRGSETEFSELTKLFCAGLNVRQDGNPFTFHHKVFIVDNDIVMTGSFNISENATSSNDENIVIIQEADLAAQYLAEFNRMWLQATAPEGLTCN